MAVVVVGVNSYHTYCDTEVRIRGTDVPKNLTTWWATFHIYLLGSFLTT